MGDWRYRGTIGHLDEQCRRLGVELPVQKLQAAQKNPEIYRANALLGQMRDRWGRAPRDEQGRRSFGAQELLQVRGTLGEAGKESDKLHALAASAEAMLADAYAAFGLEPPGRPYRIHCDFDDLPAPAAPDLQPIRIQPGSRRSKERDRGQLLCPEQRPSGQPRE
jgi:hypothetical protein